MNENVLKELLGEMLKREFEEFDDPPKWKFSLKHRLAMKRIFARYEMNVQKLKEKSIEKTAPTEQHYTYHSFKQRLIIALCIVLLMTFLVGWVVVFVSRDFHGTVRHEYTLLNAKNYENAPLTIECVYTLNSVPEGFELIETIPSPTSVYTLYENSLTDQTIALSQWVKSHFAPHVNTEHRAPEEIAINGSTGLYIDLSRDSDKTLLIWDNGDYIFELSADLDKKATIDLAKINKVEKIGISYAP